MNLDITFCLAKQCQVKHTCDRCIDRLNTWIMSLPEGAYVRPISQTDLSDKQPITQPCERFMKRED